MSYKGSKEPFYGQSGQKMLVLLSSRNFVYKIFSKLYIGLLYYSKKWVDLANKLPSHKRLDFSFMFDANLGTLEAIIHKKKKNVCKSYFKRF